MKYIDDVIEEQEIFLENVNLTLVFLKAYKNNPDQFDLLFSKEVREHYKFRFDNSEYLWESLDEVSYDIANRRKKFHIKSNGIFETIHFAKPKKKTSSVKDIYKLVYPLSERKWEI